jgi:hypothetical protein
MTKLANKSDQLPRALHITGVSDIPGHATCHGGFADVYSGTWKSRKVALKRLRLFSDPDTNLDAKRVG